MLQVEHFGDPAVYSEERGIVQACMQASFPESAVHVEDREPLPNDHIHLQASGAKRMQHSLEAASVHDHAGPPDGPPRRRLRFNYQDFCSPISVFLNLFDVCIA